MVRPHPEGTDITQLKLAAKEKTQAMRAVTADKDAGLWEWDWLGPGNIGGRVRAILLHPTDQDVMWVGSASGGIWKTTSGGASWYPLWDFMPSLSVTALEMDPQNPDIIYAATGEGFTWMPPGAGIFKSFNGGGTWMQLSGSVNSTDYRWINDLIIDPTDGNVLLAATKSEEGLGYIIRSEDAGQTWEKVLANTYMFTDLAMDPDDPNIILASTTQGVFRSDQKGIAFSWDEVSDGMFGGLPDITGRTAFSFGVGNDMVYASLDLSLNNDPLKGEIWRSSDNGLTWEWRSNPGHLKNQGTYDNVIWLEPGSTNRLIIGGINLSFSNDGGATFIAMSDWTAYHEGLSAHADQHVIVPHINYHNGSNTIFFGNDGGIQANTLGMTIDPHWGWVNLAHNLGVTQFYHGDASPDGSVMLGGSQDNDDLRYRRTAGAQAWYQASTGDGTFTAIDPTPTVPGFEIMYTAYVYLDISISLNGGDSYSSRINGLLDATQEDKALFVAPFALDKVWPANLMAGGMSIWRTSNHGEYWHQVLTPRDGNPLCSAVEISPTGGSVVTWVGYTDGSIWKTENAAEDWTEVPGPVAGTGGYRHIMDLEISPHDPNTIIAVYAGYAADRVWITRNNGQTWQPLPGTGDGQLPEIEINCVTFHPANPQWIYVGSDIGIFASEDLGEHWSVTQRLNLSEGPAYVEVSDLFWHSGQTLVAATYGRGMYECRPLEYVFVNLANTGAEDGSAFYPFTTVGEGYCFIGNGANLVINTGEYDEGPRVLTKRITLTGENGTVVVK